MNRKGFSLIELLGCLILLGLILGIGLFLARDTLATTLSTLTDISEREMCDAAEAYVLENSVTWTNNGEEYTCLTVGHLVDMGYFSMQDVDTYKDIQIKITRNPLTKVIDDTKLVDVCN